MILGYIDWDQAVRDGLTREAPLWWHTAGLQPTRSGYGGKLTTSRMLKWQGRWRRVYVACYGNAGTAYITHGPDWIVVH